MCSPNLFVCFLNHFSSSSCSFIASLDSISLLNTVREALSHPGWRSAMVDEMQALDDNCTWDLVPLLTSKRLLVVIGCLQSSLILMGLFLD